MRAHMKSLLVHPLLWACSSALICEKMSDFRPAHVYSGTCNGLDSPDSCDVQSLHCELEWKNNKCQVMSKDPTQCCSVHGGTLEPDMFSSCALTGALVTGILIDPTIPEADKCGQQVDFGQDGTGTFSQVMYYLGSRMGCCGDGNAMCGASQICAKQDDYLPNKQFGAWCKGVDQPLPCTEWLLGHPLAQSCSGSWTGDSCNVYSGDPAACCEARGGTSAGGPFERGSGTCSGMAFDINTVGYDPDTGKLDCTKRSSFDGQTTQTVGTMVGWMASSGIGCCGASRDSMCGTVPEYTMTLYDDATCDTEMMTLNGVSMTSGLEGPSSQGYQCIEGDNGIAGALSQKGQCAGEDKIEFAWYDSASCEGSKVFSVLASKGKCMETSGVPANSNIPFKAIKVTAIDGCGGGGGGGGGGLSTEAKIGAGVGGAIGGVLILGMIVFCICKGKGGGQKGAQSASV